MTLFHLQHVQYQSTIHIYPPRLGSMATAIGASTSREDSRVGGNFIWCIWKSDVEIPCYVDGQPIEHIQQTIQYPIEFVNGENRTYVSQICVTKCQIVF